MEGKTDEAKEPKSVWNDISKSWKRVAAVITAVGVIATFITKIFNTPPELTYSIFTALGIILLIISFYVDRQSVYIHEEVVNYEKKARADFIEVMQKARQQTIDMKEDSNKKINDLAGDIKTLLKVSGETRRDTVRIQLFMIMHNNPDNIDTILKMAEMYFVDLKGDWYMTNEFNKWAKHHDVIVPTNIYDAMKNNHNE